MTINKPVVIDLNEVAMATIHETYINTYGPLDPNITANDIDYHICEIIKQSKQLIADRNEVHSWILCACITTPDDMMQNAGRIGQITLPIE